MGGKLGTIFARAGHDVVFSYARSQQKLEKLAREAKGNASAGTPREAARRSHHMKCPKCGYDLITGEWHGVQVDQCTHCHGIWFDAGEAETLLAHPEPTMLARVFRTVLRGVSGVKASDP